jgi:hypothetical protein
MISSTFQGYKDQGDSEYGCGIHAQNNLKAGSKGPAGYSDFP